MYVQVKSAFDAERWISAREIYLDVQQTITGFLLRFACCDVVHGYMESSCLG